MISVETVVNKKRQGKDKR